MMVEGEEDDEEEEDEGKEENGEQEGEEEEIEKEKEKAKRTKDVFFTTVTKDDGITQPNDFTLMSTINQFKEYCMAFVV